MALIVIFLKGLGVRRNMVPDLPPHLLRKFRCHPPQPDWSHTEQVLPTINIFSREIEPLGVYPSCRWVLIYYPGSSDRIFTRTKSKFYISLCWLLPLCMLLPSVSGVFGYHGLKCSTRSCTLLRDSNGHSPKPLFYIVGLILPCTVLSITNILIFLRVSPVGEEGFELQFEDTQQLVSQCTR